MGGFSSSTLNSLARELWQWCEKRCIVIFASYITSAENWEVDFESRRLNPDTEISLTSQAFSRLVARFGPCNIDVFASRTTTKCQRYYSWFPDPGAEGIDAFTFSWSTDTIYAFPPFCLISKTLQKIRLDQASGILVVPFWPTQPCFWPFAFRIRP